MIAGYFAGSQKLPYQLYAVFVHRGSVSFGHYWIYIYDYRSKFWRKYNDEYVTEVQNLDEIFSNRNEQNPPTPYFLVYINEQMKDRLVDPVCRDIIEVPQATETTDDVLTAMEDIVSTNPIEDVHMDLTADQQVSTEPSASAAVQASQDVAINENV